jgi:hypothetical protein
MGLGVARSPLPYPWKRGFQEALCHIHGSCAKGLGFRVCRIRD